MSGFGDKKDEQDDVPHSPGACGTAGRWRHTNSDLGINAIGVWKETSRHYKNVQWDDLITSGGKGPKMTSPRSVSFSTESKEWVGVRGRGSKRASSGENSAAKTLAWEGLVVFGEWKRAAWWECGERRGRRWETRLQEQSGRPWEGLWGFSLGQQQVTGNFWHGTACTFQRLLGLQWRLARKCRRPLRGPRLEWLRFAWGETVEIDRHAQIWAIFVWWAIGGKWDGALGACVYVSHPAWSAATSVTPPPVK